MKEEELYNNGLSKALDFELKLFLNSLASFFTFYEYVPESESFPFGFASVDGAMPGVDDAEQFTFCVCNVQESLDFRQDIVVPKGCKPENVAVHLGLKKKDIDLNISGILYQILAPHCGRKFCTCTLRHDDEGEYHSINGAMRGREGVRALQVTTRQRRVVVIAPAEQVQHEVRGSCRMPSQGRVVLAHELDLSKVATDELLDNVSSSLARDELNRRVNDMNSEALTRMKDVVLARTGADYEKLCTKLMSRECDTASDASREWLDNFHGVWSNLHPENKFEDSVKDKHYNARLLIYRAALVQEMESCGVVTPQNGDFASAIAKWIPVALEKIVCSQEAPRNGHSHGDTIFSIGRSVGQVSGVHTFKVSGALMDAISKDDIAVVRRQCNFIKMNMANEMSEDAWAALCNMLPEQMVFYMGDSPFFPATDSELAGKCSKLFTDRIFCYADLAIAAGAATVLSHFMHVFDRLAPHAKNDKGIAKPMDPSLRHLMRTLMASENFFMVVPLCGQELVDRLGMRPNWIGKSARFLLEHMPAFSKVLAHIFQEYDPYAGLSTPHPSESHFSGKFPLLPLLRAVVEHQPAHQRKACVGSILMDILTYWTECMGAHAFWSRIVDYIICIKESREALSEALTHFNRSWPLFWCDLVATTAEMGHTRCTLMLMQDLFRCGVDKKAKDEQLAKCTALINLKRSIDCLSTREEHLIPLKEGLQFAQKRLAYVRREQEDVALARQQRLLEELEHELEMEMHTADTKPKSKDAKKKAEEERKKRAEGKKKERADKAEQQRARTDEAKFVEEWIHKVDIGLKHGRANFDEYRAMAHGKERDSKKQLMWKRWSDFKKMRGGDPRFALLVEHEAPRLRVDQFVALFEQLNLEENPPKLPAPKLPAPELPAPERQAPTAAPEPPPPLAPAALSRSQQKKLRKRVDAEAVAAGTAITPLDLERIANDTPDVSPPPSMASSPEAVAEQQRILDDIQSRNNPPGEKGRGSGGRGSGGRGGRGRGRFHQNAQKFVLIEARAPPPPPPPPTPVAAARETPEELCCPITMEPMLDAQTVPCGHSFSKGALQSYLDGKRAKKERFSCPLCNAYIDPTKVVTAFALQSLAAKYV